MIATPLLTEGFQVSFTCPEPTPDVGATAAVNPLGAPGAPRGVARTAGLHAPLPAGLRAATRNEYGVPLVSPVTMVVVAVDTPSLTVVHVVPPLAEDWMT